MPAIGLSGARLARPGRLTCQAAEQISSSLPSQTATSEIPSTTPPPSAKRQTLRLAPPLPARHFPQFQPPSCNHSMKVRRSPRQREAFGLVRPVHHVSPVQFKKENT
jgi:hypothetical protein